MKIKKNIGLFGGAFNPIHNSHISMAKYLLDKRLVDEVWIMPCKKHAFDKHLASSKDRIKMIDSAFKNFKKVKICRIEIKSKGTNYTFTTLRKLRKKYPYHFILIHGADMLKDIEKWHNYKQLLKEADFILFNRKNYPLKERKGMKCRLIKDFDLAMSSTDIRKKLKEGKSISTLVPKSVEKYIFDKRLYKE